MKLKFCLRMTFWEVRTHIKLFVFYILIFTLLFSMATALLNVAMYLPDGVGELASKETLDFVCVDSIDNIAQLEQQLEEYEVNLIDIKDNEITIERLGLSNEEHDILDFGAVLDTKWSNELKEYLKYNFNSGEFLPEKLNVNGSAAIWFDESVAETFKLNIGDEITIYDKDGIASDKKLYIQGLYKNEVSEKYNYYINDCYFSINAYNYFHDVDKREDCNICISPEKFRDVFSIIALLEDISSEVYYENTFINAIRMMYITLYAFNIVLFIALSGILLHLMDMYYEKRDFYWAINSAIGMSYKDIMRILLCIYELILIIVSVASIFVSYLILNGINNMSQDLFEMNLITNQISVYPYIFNFILLQLCLLFVLYKFRKKLLNTEIVQLLHCE